MMELDVREVGKVDDDVDDVEVDVDVEEDDLRHNKGL